MRISDLTLLASVASAALVGGGLIVWFRLRKRTDPEVLRRQRIDAAGRLIEGMVTDVQDCIVVYCWSWRGVEYEASQDLRALAHLMPESEDILIGPVTVKFLAKDPSNSIVLSERWSGFREPRSRIRGIGRPS